MRILIAEDNPLNQTMLLEICRAAQLETQLAADGAEAIKAMEAGEFDLILMDIHMPLVNGIEASRAIRAMAAPKGQIPIIAVTADVTQATHEACLAAGINEIITKPVGVRALQERIKSYRHAA